MHDQTSFTTAQENNRKCVGNNKATAILFPFLFFFSFFSPCTWRVNRNVSTVRIPSISADSRRRPRVGRRRRSPSRRRAAHSSERRHNDVSQRQKARIRYSVFGIRHSAFGIRHTQTTLRIYAAGWSWVNSVSQLTLRCRVTDGG